MGSFFTSTQILNASNLSKEEITKKFHDMMKKDDYVMCEADEGELSYAFSFADNSKWLTMSSESYNEGDNKASKDIATIARIFKTVCLKTVVIDSDCAIIDLFDSKGNKADTLVMGRADEYMGDDIQAPEKAMWESLMVENATWEKFISVQQGDYTFVEEGLSLLAPLIGVDSNNILMDYDDLCSASEKNQNAFYLYFKKANKKTLTFDAAFKKVFGEALEPLGFKKIKSKHPYFVRVVPGGEIIHIIRYKNEWTGEYNHKAFDIYSGIATVYRSKIELNPIITTNWLREVSSFYIRSNPNDYDEKILKGIRKFLYKKDDSESLIKTVNIALEATKQFILPMINKAVDINSCIEFLDTMNLHLNIYSYDENFGNDNPNREYSEGLLYFKIEDPKKRKNGRNFSKRKLLLRTH